MRYAVLVWSFVLFVFTLAIPLGIQRANATVAPLEDRRQQVVWGKYDEPPVPAQTAPDAPTAPSSEALHALINEVAPIGAPGKPSWIELIVPVQRTYLPLIARGDGGSVAARSPYSSAEPGLPGWIVVVDIGPERTSHVFTVPLGMTAAPLGARILISVGVAGADDFDFSDGVGGVHWSTAPSYTIGISGGAIALYRGEVTLTKMVDFVAWGDYGGARLREAALTGLWQENAAHSFDTGFGGEDGRASPWLPNQSIGRFAGVWASYLARDSSKGKPNPVPVPMRTNRPTGSSVNSTAFGAVWTPVPGAAGYEFQLSSHPSFTTLLVNEIVTTPGWYPDSPLSDGQYWWRVQTIAADGRRSRSYGPLEQWSTTLVPPPDAVVLLNESQYRMQRKDTTMLDIGGGPGNSGGSGSPRFGTRDRWDGPHVDEDTGFPTFSWNGYDNIACVRASIAMVTLYYGGNLSVDRINYFIFEQNAGNDYPSKGVPEGDMGFGKGSSSKAALEWALNAPTDGKAYCPDPPDSADDEDFYCGVKDATPNTAPITITFATIKSLIDSGRPIVRQGDGHVTVVDGYMTDINGKLWVRNVDPIPVDDADCVPGQCLGFEWWEFSVFRQLFKGITYVADGETPDPRSDEPTIAMDSDSDGINDFDEIVRFNTDPHDKDSDNDWVNDKEDIAEYVFNRNDEYSKRFGDLFLLGYGPGIFYDLESDTVRKELDWDHDNDTIPDGCEDVNRDGRYGTPLGENAFTTAGERNNFDPASTQPCVPSPFLIWEPHRFEPENVGSYLNPDPFVAKIFMPLPQAQTPKPLYNKNNFTATIGVLNAPVLATAKAGSFYYLLLRRRRKPRQTCST